MTRLIRIYVILFLFSLAIIYDARGDEFVYYSKGKRDPFIPLILGDMKTSLGLQVVETIDDISLEGIIFDPSGKSMAILNGEIIKAGDKVNNVKILAIHSNSINIKIYDEPYSISLIEEGGE